MRWRPPSPRVLLGAACAYMAVIGACLFAGLFVVPEFASYAQGELLARGCYRTPPVFFGTQCHGFAGAAVAEVLLSLHIVLVLGPFAGFFELASFGESGDLRALAHGGVILAVTIALWTPIVYLAARIYRAWRDMEP